MRGPPGRGRVVGRVRRVGFGGGLLRRGFLAGFVLGARRGAPPSGSNGRAPAPSNGGGAGAVGAGGRGADTTTSGIASWGGGGGGVSGEEPLNQSCHGRSYADVSLNSPPIPPGPDGYQGARGRVPGIVISASVLGGMFAIHFRFFLIDAM